MDCHDLLQVRIAGTVLGVGPQPFPDPSLQDVSPDRIVSIGEGVPGLPQDEIRVCHLG